VEKNVENRLRFDDATAMSLVALFWDTLYILRVDMNIRVLNALTLFLSDSKMFVFIILLYVPVLLALCHK